MEGALHARRRQRRRRFRETPGRPAAACRGSGEPAPGAASRATPTFGVAASSRGARAAPSPSRARDAALAGRRPWPGPGLPASPTASASPSAGPRLHLLAGRLLRAAGARGRAAGPSQWPAACAWPSRGRGPCRRGAARPATRGPGRAWRWFHPRGRAERGAWPGWARRLSALPAPRRGAAKFGEKFEAGGSEAAESAFVRRPRRP